MRCPKMQVLRFWKPYEVLTQFTDTEGRTNLANFIPVPNVYPIGRLDYGSEGLLLLTDNGVLSHRLTDPRYEHPRTYLAQVERIPDEYALEQLRAGVDIKGGRTRPAIAELVESSPDLPARSTPIRYRKNVATAWIKLTITEGRNHQVRRMTAAIGHPTLRLIRWSMGPITLIGLQPGNWQRLDDAQIDSLWNGLFPRTR